MTPLVIKPITRCNPMEATIYLCQTLPDLLTFDFQHVVRHFLRNLADHPEQIDGLAFYHADQAFFFAPESDANFDVTVTGNFFEGQMSAQAFGITASLFALGYLCEQQSSDEMIDAYHRLRMLACEHAEHALILRAID